MAKPGGPNDFFRRSRLAVLGFPFGIPGAPCFGEKHPDFFADSLIWKEMRKEALFSVRRRFLSCGGAPFAVICRENCHFPHPSPVPRFPAVKPAWRRVNVSLRRPAAWRHRWPSGNFSDAGIFCDGTGRNGDFRETLSKGRKRDEDYKANIRRSRS